MPDIDIHFETPHEVTQNPNDKSKPKAPSNPSDEIVRNQIDREL